MQIQKEKKHAKFRFSFILLFIFASFAACFALYMRSDSDDILPASKNLTDENNEVSEDNAVYSEKNDMINPVPKSSRAEDGYFDNAIILASNQMRGLSDYGAVPKDNMYTGDFSPSDIITSGATSFVYGKDYDSIYIMFGANAAAAADFEELSTFIANIKESDENVKIYLTSLIPLKADSEIEGLTNTEIESFNSFLLKYANENGVHYIDLNTFLVGNDAKLPKSKAESVGDRLKKDTYLEIADFLLTHIA
ncbi:MAG: hypothetical protein ACI4SF_06305 [Oscillospiraceae bacterium]